MIFSQDLQAQQYLFNDQRDNLSRISRSEA